jgi:hypothetical protein
MKSVNFLPICNQTYVGAKDVVYRGAPLHAALWRHRSSRIVTIKSNGCAPGACGNVRTLLANAHGLAGKPVNEAVGCVDHQRMRNEEPQAMGALCDLMGDRNWQPTFMFRFGYTVRQVSPPQRF